MRGIGFRWTLRFLVEPCSFRSLGRAARVLSEYCRVSKTSVWRWVVKLREKLSMASERKARRFIAVDETCVKVNTIHLQDGIGLWNAGTYSAKHSYTTTTT